jgi:hypothetical protein
LKPVFRIFLPARREAFSFYGLFRNHVNRVSDFASVKDAGAGFTTVPRHACTIQLGCSRMREALHLLCGMLLARNETRETAESKKHKQTKGTGGCHHLKGRGRLVLVLFTTFSRRFPALQRAWVSIGQVFVQASFACHRPVWVSQWRERFLCTSILYGHSTCPRSSIAQVMDKTGLGSPTCADSNPSAGAVCMDELDVFCPTAPMCPSP